MSSRDLGRLPSTGLASCQGPRLRCAAARGRAAIVMPAMFALGDKVIGNPTVATFAAFGSFAMLLLVDFGGPMRDRLQAQAALAVAGAVFVCLGTLASRVDVAGRASRWRSSRSPCCSPAWSARCSRARRPRCCSPSSCRCRCPARSRRSRTGWPAGASRRAASLLAVALLWPAPARDPLRAAAAAACRALAGRLRADVAYMLGATPAARRAIGARRRRAPRRTRRSRPLRPAVLRDARTARPA